MTTNTIENSAGIKASVNEHMFFKGMKHLFSSSKSVIGELLQNARRAGASKITVEADQKARFLAFTDDGCGIEDFQILLRMSESGWSDEKVLLSDKPFGMGFFSTFFAAEKVVIYSKGRKLEVCKDDIISQREMHTTQTSLFHSCPDLNFPQAVTRIELHGAELGIFNYEGGYTRDNNIESVMKHWCSGFPIPVVLNGKDVPRPLAPEQVPGQMHRIGVVSIRGLHGDLSPLGRLTESNIQLFLQGLPIGRNHILSHRDASAVVHLDSASFIARMPDRDALYDHDKQMSLIIQGLREVCVNWLTQRKAELTPQDFVVLHWRDCENLGVLDLLNDLPFIPKHKFLLVNNVAIDSQNFPVLSHEYSSENALVSRSDIVAGQVGVWIDPPVNSGECHLSATGLKVMQNEGIHGLDANDFDKGHWLFDVAPRWATLDLTIEVLEPADKVVNFCWNNHSADIRFAKQVLVNVRSTAGVAYALTSVFNADWLLFPKPGQEDETDDFTYDCYLVGNDASPDHPVDALVDFSGEFGDLQEEWRSDAVVRWDDLIASLRSDPLATVLKRHLPKLDPVFQPEHAAELVGLRLSRHWNEFSNQYDRGTLDAFALDMDFMSRVSTHLAQQGLTVDAASLFSAVKAVAQPGLTDNRGTTPNQYCDGNQLIQAQ